MSPTRAPRWPNMRATARPIPALDAAVYVIPTDAPDGGALHPDPSRPGHGMSLRTADAEPFRRV